MENEIHKIAPFSNATVRLGMDGTWTGADNRTSYFVMEVTPGVHHLCASWQSSPKMPAKNAIEKLFSEVSMQMRFLLPLVIGFALMARVLAAPVLHAQTMPSATPPATLRSTLLAQLHSSHDKAEWFVPVNTAIAGLTPEQAKWIPTNAAGKIDTNANHSVGMLTYHLWFWNAQALAKLKKESVPKAPDNNDETFNDFNAASWTKTVKDLDQVMTSLEDLVAHASDADLAKWAPTFANISTHNAYHTGQILYVRKLQGSWNPNNGVK